LGAPVFKTRVGHVGVAICYDRHFPEYMRALGQNGADLVVVPQAGVIDEWPDGLFEGEMQTAAFQNGYFVALCNRVGAERHLTFAGESFVCGPEGASARGRRREANPCSWRRSIWPTPGDHMRGAYCSRTGGRSCIEGG
jgi:predicted amidohydrolase